MFLLHFRPAETISASTVAEITRALAASIITNARNNKESTIQTIDNQVSVTMATAAAQRVAVSISSTSALGAISPSSIKMKSNNNSNNNNNNNNSNGFVLPNNIIAVPKKSKQQQRIDEEWKEVTRV